MTLESVITCPHCATAKAEAMPTDACRFFYLFMHGLRRDAAAEAGRLLRVLFLRFGAVPADPGRAFRPKCCGVLLREVK